MHIELPNNWTTSKLTILVLFRDCAAATYLCAAATYVCAAATYLRAAATYMVDWLRIRLTSAKIEIELS